MKHIKKNLLFNFDLSQNDMIDFIAKSIRKRIDMGTTWIYHNYINYKLMYELDFLKMHSGKNFEIKEEQKIQYEDFLCKLFLSLQQHDPRDLILSKILNEIPYLPEGALMFIKSYCENDARSYIGLSTLKSLLIRRPGLKEELLQIILELTCNNTNDIRTNAIVIVKKLHEKDEFRKNIESYALTKLKCLVALKPKMHQDTNEEWNEENIKPFLYLYLELMPMNHSLIFPLSQIYTGAVPEVKRTILRMLEQPVKEIGMESVDLLKLVEDCPQGCETLITRIIHILTDKVPPSTCLVEKVRDLYLKRISDVRFLIPVLNFLPKKEIIDALPSIIKLSPTIVKEVFNRLLVNHVNLKPSITPAELLIALHTIDQTCDLKTIINATSLCFAEKNVYTHDVLAAVIQQLVDITPIPTLLMRTVIQSLSIYPKLTNFIINILQKLISKQIWRFPKVWEGFIKCCQRTKPASIPLLFQLPPNQLKDILSHNSDINESFKNYVSMLNSSQKASIPDHIFKVLDETTSSANGSKVQ